MVVVFLGVCLFGLFVCLFLGFFLGGFGGFLGFFFEGGVSFLHCNNEKSITKIIYCLHEMRKYRICMETVYCNKPHIFKLN